MYAHIYVHRYGALDLCWLGMFKVFYFLSFFVFLAKLLFRVIIYTCLLTSSVFQQHQHNSARNGTAFLDDFLLRQPTYLTTTYLWN